jgi:flagellar assembly protein FliH
LSRIIRQFGQSSTVFIGDKHSDVEREFAAERVLTELFPDVEVATSPEGKRFVPLREFVKIKSVLDKVMGGSWERGNRDGYQRGLKEGQAEGARVVGEFEEIVLSAISDRHRLYEEAKSNVLSLVTKISRKVTFDAVAVDPEITLKIICGVMDQLIDKTSIKIKVHPSHLPVVEQNVDKFLKTDSAIKQYQIEGDTRVKFGGCLIETPTGDIDARLESQFEVVNQSLATGDV